MVRTHRRRSHSFVIGAPFFWRPDAWAAQKQPRRRPVSDITSCDQGDFRIYVAAQLRTRRRQSGLSAPVAAIPIVVLFLMLGRVAEAGLDGGARGARSALRRVARRLRHAGAAGADLDALRRRLRAVPDRLDRVRVDHALPPGGRHRQVRDHQGLGRRPDRRPPAAGDVHRLLVRRVHRGRRRLRRAGGRVGRDARRASASIRSTPPASACSPTPRRWRSARSASRSRRWRTSPACR